MKLHFKNSTEEKTIIRSSPPEVFLEKGVLKICIKFTGEYPCQSVVSIKLLCLGAHLGEHGCSHFNKVSLLSMGAHLNENLNSFELFFSCRSFSPSIPVFLFLNDGKIDIEK